MARAIVESPFDASFATYAVVLAAAFPVLAAWRGMHRMNARYASIYDQVNLCIVSACLSLVVAFAEIPLQDQAGLAFPLLFGFLTVSGFTGSRVALRLWNWGLANPARPERRVILVGAGDAGESVLREIIRCPNSVYTVVGFADDDTAKHDQLIQGVRVYGSVVDIPNIVRRLSAHEVFVTMPSASGAALRRVHDICALLDVPVRTLPGVSELLRAPTALRMQFREVQVEDLLRREPTPVDPDLVASITRGESVLVTGGGGSIGSELGRQVAQLAPAKLILLGKGENSLYEIEQELIQTSPFQAACVVADVRDANSMQFAFERHHPTVVFHAAAHKHVPLMQSNPIEAIRNNVFGTRCALQTSLRHGVKKFVLISTDKAVNPTSVMGATKRVAEMIVSAATATTETDLAIVRFGNVLGSRGSLIPLLKSQIARGGPVRITHPEMTRYFMTIPEAVHLILQAGAVGRRGELFLLDMGDPIRIVDLAEDLIRLHGLIPGKDIEIKFIGPRPGEKLHEELTYAEEDLAPTAHPKIRMARSAPVDAEWLRDQLDYLAGLCDAGDHERAQQFLMELALGKTNVLHLPYSPERKSA